MHQSIPFQDIKKFSFFKASERKIAVVQHLIGRSICRSVKRADKIIVQSEWIRDAVIKKCNIDRSKIVNILPTLKDLSGYVEEGVFDKTRFFYPTAPAVYKNNDVIFKASEILTSDGIRHSVKLTLPPEKSRGEIECVNRLPYEEVLSEYNKSTLVFPSYIETVGYPMLEARMLGGIVLASDCPFSREVLKDYENAYFFDPFNANELAKLMKDVVTGKITKKKVETVGGEFNNTWRDVLKEIISIFR